MGRGWVPPGYRYLGPGNDLNRGAPTNEADRLAQEHDKGYEALLKAGAKPYTQWSDADHEFFSNLTVNDIPTAVAKGLFGLKKGLHQAGIIGKASLPKKRTKEHMGRQRKTKKPRAFDPLMPDTWGLGAGAQEDDAWRQDEGEADEPIPFADTPNMNENIVIDHGPAPDDGGAMSLTDLLPDTQDDPTTGMDIDMDSNGPEAAQVQARQAQGGQNQVSKETPISRYPSLTYGLQETHTTILPWTGYLSATGFDHVAPVVLQLKMTQPFDMIGNVIQGIADAGQWGKNLYNTPYNNAATKPAGAATFPCILDTGGADPNIGANTEEASWWEYWKRLYEYYTVLGCEYEIVINNPGNVEGTEGLVGWDYNSYSATSGASGNITPQQERLAVMKQYKGLKWRTIPIASDDSGKSSTTMIKGRYMPGMARRNIQNDGDVKTWHKTNGTGDAEPPSLREFLTLYFYRHELAYAAPASKIIGVNMQITLKYIVQFKDLFRNARYPNNEDGNITTIIDTHAQQFPTGI